MSPVPLLKLALRFFLFFLFFFLSFVAFKTFLIFFSEKDLCFGRLEIGHPGSHRDSVE